MPLGNGCFVDERRPGVCEFDPTLSDTIPKLEWGQLYNLRRGGSTTPSTECPGSPSVESTVGGPGSPPAEEGDVSGEDDVSNYDVVEV